MISSVLVLMSAVLFGQPEIVPKPVRAEFQLGTCVPLAADLPFRVCVEDESARAAAVSWVTAHAKAVFGVNLGDVSAPPPAGPASMADEAYELTVGTNGVTILAKNLAGVRHGFGTLRQMALPQRGTLKVEGWIAPAGKVVDRPRMSFRGIHLCWFPETKVTTIERCIRLAAYYRMNTVVLETWGTFRSERYPWWGWAEGTMTKAEIHRLKAIADDLGVTLVPQFNIYGHASMSRSRSAKHAVIDRHPEYQTLYEPSGWNWCLTNPEALKVIDGLVVEMHEAFGNPPYFHIGCDEAEAQSCPTCRTHDNTELVAAHITRVARILEGRGARAMMWHDMLLKKGEWKPFYANATRGEEKMLGRLPKSVVICDWFYGLAQTNGYPTLTHFRQAGYDVVTSPWENEKGTLAQGKAAAEAGALGILGTTWHHVYKFAISRQFVPCAAAGWGTAPGAVSPRTGAAWAGTWGSTTTTTAASSPNRCRGRRTPRSIRAAERTDDDGKT